MSTYNDERSFERGQVFFVRFDGERHIDGRPSRVLRGDHRAVVLFNSTFPRNTVVVLPISSLCEPDGTEKQTISSDVILDADNYRGMIREDSFIMTNQIQSVTRNRLERHVGEINELDMIKVDLQLISTLNLEETIQGIVESEVDRRIEELGYVLEEDEDGN